MKDFQNFLKFLFFYDMLNNTKFCSMNVNHFLDQFCTMLWL